MLYEEGSLTIEQAEQIIGEKMMARIECLNNWAKQNGYRIMMHSTFKSAIKSIFSEGLKYTTSETFDSREEILCDSSISEKDLVFLENYVMANNGHAAQLSKLYDTYLPVESATVTGFSQITAKDLLEYNHKGGNATILFCVPIKKVDKVGRNLIDEFRIGFVRHIDPYLKRAILCKKGKDGSLKYKSNYFYPTQGILFAFDRENVRIKYNDEFDETFYFDTSTPQRMTIRKGELLTSLKEIDITYQQNGNHKK